MHVHVATAMLCALLLGACRPPLGEGLPAIAAGALQPCLVQTGAVRDHCAVTVASQLDLTGEQWLLLCDQLGGGTAQDLCVERAAWTERAPAPYAVCSRIRVKRTRQSCMLGATNALAKGPIGPLLDVCARTEELETDCWVHVASERRYLWLEKGKAKLLADVAEAIALDPRLAGSVPFASEIGRAQAQLSDAPDPAVCALFEPQVPQMSCHTSAQAPSP